jgi:exopolysaccharide biosynthesis polyprenyl glycosylphosphotransferase
LVVGTGDDSARLIGSLKQLSGQFKPVGYVAASGYPPVPDGLPIVATIDQIDQAIRDHRIDCLFVTSTGVPPEDLERVVTVGRRTGAEVRIQTRLEDTLVGRVSVEEVGTSVAMALRSATLTRSQAVAKRALDIALGSLGILVAAPLWVLITLAIRTTSKGAALFNQDRVTAGGRTFVAFKFRTMIKDADKFLADRPRDLAAAFFKIEDDPRITRVGKVLRRFSLDELPQLLNVVRGDMSLVGPRPLRVEQVEANPWLAPRHEVRAGLTGWWQVRGRSEISADEALRLDRLYIENWSLRLDLSIIFRTIGVVLRGTGAW